MCFLCYLYSYYKFREQISFHSLLYICSQMETVTSLAYLMAEEVLKCVENCWINQQANRIILLTEFQSVVPQIPKLVMGYSYLISIQLTAPWPISPRLIVILSSFLIHSLLLSHFLIEFSVKIYTLILYLLQHVLYNISNYLSVLGKYCK